MERHLATVGINIVVAYQWASLLFIPGVYGSLGDELGFTIEQLGLLLTNRLIAMYFSLIFFAWTSLHWPRNLVLVVTVGMSGIFTLLNMASNDYPTFLMLDILAGMSLGAVVPVARSLIPNYYVLEERGRYFGYLELSQGVGGIFGVGISTYIVSTGKLRVWSMVYLFMAMLAFPVCCVSMAWIKDPIRDTRSRKELQEIYPGLQMLEDDIPSKRDIRDIFRNPVFIGIVGQGIGAFPWSGLSFLILWFQRMGVPESLGILIYGAVGIGAALGGLFGGLLGDWISKRDLCGVGQKFGRISVAHVSVIMGIPFIAVLMNAIPYEFEFWWVYALVGGLMGLIIAWPPANNSAVLSDIFPQRLHPIAFAIQYCFEGGLASFSPYLTGYLTSEVFGGKDLTPPGGEAQWVSFSPERQHAALKGLAMSLTLIGVTFWGISQFFYILMYCYYPGRSRSLNNI